MKKLLFTFILLIVGSILFAGPFGLEFGWTLEDLAAKGIEISNVEDQGESIICTADVLYPHEDIDVYILLIDKEYGLFQIAAIAFGNPDTYESGTQKVFSNLKGQLTSKYGESPLYLDEYFYDDFDFVNWDLEVLSGKRLIEIWQFDSDSEMKQVVLQTEVFQGVLSCSLSYLANSWDLIEARRNEHAVSVL